MEPTNETYGKFKDEMGREYHCPISAVADNHIVSEWEIDSCIEDSTASRDSEGLNNVE